MANIMNITPNADRRGIFYKTVVDKLYPMVMWTTLPRDAQGYSMELCDADGDFNKWLANGDTDKAVQDFIAALPDTEKGKHLRDMANAYFDLVRELKQASADLAEPEDRRPQNDRLDAINRKLHQLMDNDAFHEAIEAFNADSKGKHAEKPGMKILINMSLRLDQAAAAMDEMVCDEYTKTVDECSRDVEAVDTAINLYQKHLNNERTARNTVGYDEITEQELQAELERGERTVSELETEIDRQYDHIQELKDQWHKAGEAVEKAIDDHEKAKRQVIQSKNDIENKIPANMKQQQALLAGYINASKAEDAAQADEKHQLDAYKTLPIHALMKDQPKPESAKARAYLKNSRHLAVLKNLSENLKFERVDDFKTAVQEKNGMLKDFYALYAEHQPDKVSGIMGLFSGTKTEEQLFHDLGELKLRKLNSEFKRMIDTMQEKVTQAKAELEKEPDVKKLHAEAEKLRTKRIIECQNNIDAHAQRMAKNSHEAANAQRMIELDNQQLESMKAALPKYEQDVKTTLSAIDDRKKDQENCVNRIREAEQRREQTIARKGEVMERNRVLGSLNSLAKASDRSKQFAVQTVEEYRASPRSAAMPKDLRAARINERASTYLLHQSDCAKGHSNSQEFKNMVKALLMVRDAAPDKKAEALTTLALTAQEYQKAKGSRTILASELRHTRLNYARSIECWARTTAASLDKSLTPMSDKLAASDSRYRSDNYLTALKNMNYQTANQRTRANTMRQKTMQKTGPELRERTNSLSIKAPQLGPLSK